MSMSLKSRTFGYKSPAAEVALEDTKRSGLPHQKSYQGYHDHDSQLLLCSRLDDGHFRLLLYLTDPASQSFGCLIVFPQERLETLGV